MSAAKASAEWYPVAPSNAFQTLQLLMEAERERKISGIPAEHLLLREKFVLSSRY